MSYYENKPATNPELEKAGYFRFPVLIAIVQLLCVGWCAWLLAESSMRSGKDAWVGIYAVIPLFVLQFTVPINLISGIYYFIQYRRDEVVFKIIVGISLAISVIALMVFAK